MSHSQRILGAAAAVLVAAAPATAAVKPFKFPRRTFAVTVAGLQTTTSVYKRPGTGPCDPASSGRDVERISFASKKPKVIEMTDISPLLAIGHGKPGDGVLDTAVRVTHSNQSKHGAVGPLCIDIGGGSTEVKPDCGARRLHLPVAIDWYNPLGFVLGSADVGLPESPFKNCPVSGEMFPQLLQTTTASKPIISRLPARDLFNRRFKEHILLGSGKAVVRDSSGTTKTAISWSVTLKAVKPRH